MTGASRRDEIVWTYVPTDGEERVFSARISGAQRLQGGNTLVCCGEQGRVLEVTPEGELVWDWRNPFQDAGVGPGVGPGGRRGPRGRPGRGAGRPDGPPPEGRGLPPPPEGRGGPPEQRGARGPGGQRGGPMAGGLFRARRYAPEHSGVQRVLAAAEPTEASGSSAR